MPDITKELIAYIKTSSAVRDKIGFGDEARIYQELAKQNVPEQFIVLQTFEGDSYQCLTGLAGVGANRIQIDCYALTADDAYQLSEIVRLLPLPGFKGQMAGAFVTDVTNAGGLSKGFDNAINGGNQKRWWVSRDYLISYMEAIQV